MNRRSFITLAGGALGLNVLSSKRSYATNSALVLPTVRLVLPVGVFSLTSADETPDVLQKDASWGNPNINGVAIRATWATCEPTPGNYYWDNIKGAISLAASNSMPVALSFEGGSGSPTWLYDPPYNVQQFTFSPNTFAPMPAPWDQTFQGLWRTFAQAAAEEFSSSPWVSYVTLSGLGHGVEAYFAQTTAEQKEATDDGFPATWESGGKQIIDSWCQAWPAFCVALATGNPYPGTPGFDAMDSVTKYGINNYQTLIASTCRQFVLKSCLLSANYPNGTEFVHTTIPLKNLTENFIVYQMVGTVNSGRLNGTLEEAMKNGIAQGAKALEVYTGDANAPSQQAKIAAINAELISMA